MEGEAVEEAGDARVHRDQADVDHAGDVLRRLRAAAACNRRSTSCSRASNRTREARTPTSPRRRSSRSVGAARRTSRRRSSSRSAPSTRGSAPTARPIRAVATVTLEELKLVPPGQNPTSGSLAGANGAPSSAPATRWRRSRIRCSGSPTLWRVIAEANGIDDPARAQAGHPAAGPSCRLTIARLTMATQQISNTFVVKIDDRPLPATSTLASVVVDDHLHLPDSFVITFRDSGRTALAVVGRHDRLEGVDRCAVRRRRSTRAARRRRRHSDRGRDLRRHEQHVVRGFDDSHLLFRGRSTASYHDMTYADVAREGGPPMPAEDGHHRHDPSDAPAHHPGERRRLALPGPAGPRGRFRGDCQRRASCTSGGRSDRAALPARPTSARTNRLTLHAGSNLLMPARRRDGERAGRGGRGARRGTRRRKQALTSRRDDDHELGRERPRRRPTWRRSSPSRPLVSTSRAVRCRRPRSTPPRRRWPTRSAAAAPRSRARRGATHSCAPASPCGSGCSVSRSTAPTC